MLKFDVEGVCVLQCCSDRSINSQEYRSFGIYAVTIKTSMTEYHHLINDKCSWFILTVQYKGDMSMVNG